ncbi:O-antigen ligase [Arthrobacter pascens]|uniref:O-antigen ligase family protein n=1 Tax=Arthrobacter pascens TaxID=1677 RepID=UPI0028584A70|nr:O-antigen ligase family protein [Arthrobacter pascens]MDR6555747.1 O-antigen ligase [Arthrobacter pascens]
MSKSILMKPNRPGPPLFERLGAGLLLLVFIAMMAGRFSLDRLSPSLPSADLRLVLLYGIVLLALIWFNGAREHLPKPVMFGGSGLFLAWAAWLAFSAGWAPAGARTSDTLLDVALLVAFTLMAWMLMRRLPAEVTDRIWKWMIVAAMIYFVLAMAAGPGAQGRYAAPGGGPNVFVRVMVLGAIASLYFSSTKKKAWALLPIPFFAVGAALSGSRGGLLSALLVLVIFFIPIVRSLGWGKILLLAFGSATSGWFLLTQNNGQLWKFIEERYIQQTFVEGYRSGRDTIAEDAIRLYQQSPVIGTGMDGYYVLQDDPGTFEYPHNLVLATMAEAGTVGLVFLLACFAALVMGTWRVRPVQPSVLYAAGAGFYLGFTSLFSGDYYDTRLMWFFLGFAAVQAAKGVKDSPSLEGIPIPQPALQHQQPVVAGCLKNPSPPAPDSPANAAMTPTCTARSSAGFDL